MSAKPIVSAKVETFTPATAKAALDSSPGNRPIKTAWVRSLTAIIKGGRWRLTGQPIIFDAGARLMDGHHRLMACVAAGEPISVLVVRGADRSGFADIDNIVPRSHADVLSIAGHQSARHVASVAQFVYAWKNGLIPMAQEISSQLKAVGYNSQMTIEMVDENPGILDVTNRSKEVARAAGLRPSVVGGLMFILQHADADVASDFWNAIQTGEMLAADDPRRRLREMAINWRIRRMRVTVWETSVACIRAWNVYTDNEQCKGIRYVAIKAMPKINLLPDEWQYGSSSPD